MRNRKVRVVLQIERSVSVRFDDKSKARTKDRRARRKRIESQFLNHELVGLAGRNRRVRVQRVRLATIHDCVSGVPKGAHKLNLFSRPAMKIPPSGFDLFARIEVLSGVVLRRRPIPVHRLRVKSGSAALPVHVDVKTRGVVGRNLELVRVNPVFEILFEMYRELSVVADLSQNEVVHQRRVHVLDALARNGSFEKQKAHFIVKPFLLKHSQKEFQRSSERIEIDKSPV